MPGKKKLYRDWHTETKWHTKTTFCTSIFHSVMGRFERTSISVFSGNFKCLAVWNITYYKHKKTQSLSNSKNLLCHAQKKTIQEIVLTKNLYRDNDTCRVTHLTFRNTVLGNKSTPRSGQLNLSSIAATSTEFGLHAGNTKLNTQYEEWISIILLRIFLYTLWHKPIPSITETVHLNNVIHNLCTESCMQQDEEEDQKWDGWMTCPRTWERWE